MEFNRKPALHAGSVPNALRNPLVLSIALPLAAAFLLFVNLFWIGPILVAHGHAGLNNGLYVVFRLVVFIGLGFALSKWAGRNRPQALSSVMIVAAIDQVLWKGLWVTREMRLHPDAWAGLTVDRTGVFVGLAQGFLFFTPFVLILAFLGVELTRFRAELARDRAAAAQKLR